MSIASFLVTGGQFRLHRKEQHEGHSYRTPRATKALETAAPARHGDYVLKSSFRFEIQPSRAAEEDPELLSDSLITTGLGAARSLRRTRCELCVFALLRRTTSGDGASTSALDATVGRDGRTACNWRSSRATDDPSLRSGYLASCATTRRRTRLAVLSA